MHSSSAANWVTPPEVVEVVHVTFGAIDLDPASSPRANEIVGASKIYTADDNGLDLDNVWLGVTLLNPPGHCGDKISPVGGCPRHDHGQSENCQCIYPVCEKRRCTCDLVRKFWSRFVYEFVQGRVVGVYVGYSLEQLQTLQKGVFGDVSPLEFTICIPDRRLRYLNEATLEPGGSPTHGSFIALIADDDEYAEAFVKACEGLGVVR